MQCSKNNLKIQIYLLKGKHLIKLRGLKYNSFQELLVALLTYRFYFDLTDDALTCQHDCFDLFDDALCVPI